MIEPCPRCGLDHPGWEAHGSLDACLFALRQAIMHARPARPSEGVVPQAPPRVHFRRFAVASFHHGRLGRLGTFLTQEVAWRELRRNKLRRAAKGEHPCYVVYERGRVPWLAALERKQKKERRAA